MFVSGIKALLDLDIDGSTLGTVHKHLLGGPDAKRGALKSFDPRKGGGPEKNHQFSSEN